MNPNDVTSPLAGIRIIDLSRMLPGPFCSMILADLGAEVIVIEDPDYPFTRPPPYHQKGRHQFSAFSMEIMRNKKSMALDFHKKESLFIFYDLVKSADVLLESFRPGTAKKMQIDFSTLIQYNSHLIYCSLTGFGQTGPYASLPGHDINYGGLTGYIALNRPRSHHSENTIPSPIPTGLQAADTAGGFYAAIGILSALNARNRSSNPQGQYLDIGILDAAFTQMTISAAYSFSNQSDQYNPFLGDYPFYALYKTADEKYISVGALEPKFWAEFCLAIEHSDLIEKQFSIGEERETVFKIVQDCITQKSQADWLKHFRKYDTCVMPINSFEEACNDPQLIARGMISETPHPILGVVHNISSPIKIASTQSKKYIACPEPGEHTLEIVKSLSYSPEKIAELAQQGCFFSKSILKSVKKNSIEEKEK
jgi:crotonobetainyl-CoA:carnitine CoA-transferase CaiB-like acyl-CoA transferase